ncbi:uncharacterized protein zgc:193726 isoform X2 [Amphiprion ocellaris]|uniref:uncharacterized protein zgc:193726 isoform X2 n=1 Tax=Amphiprion ocellaris TaxID=80972 RepID=UPI001649997A|nr:uncharacterized protein zgc:193726 isoform X2 [Amphiprion ocellaris]
MTTRMKTTKTTTMMMMMMVVCVSAASLGGSRRDDMKVEGSHLENPENVSTSLKSHQDVNETLDVSTRLNSHQDINETLDNSTRITINQDVNRTVDDSTRYAMSNLPINETSITPLMFVFPLDDLKPSQETSAPPSSVATRQRVEMPATHWDLERNERKQLLDLHRLCSRF